MEHKDYCGCRIYPDGRVYLDTPQGWVLPKKPRKIAARLVLEAYRGIPKRTKHRNVWCLDGDRNNLSLNNLQWGEIKQENHVGFLRVCIVLGFAIACQRYKVSTEFGLFMIFLREIEEDEKVSFLTSNKVKWI